MRYTNSHIKETLTCFVSVHARLNSNNKAWSYKKKKHKKINAYRKYVWKEPTVKRCLLTLDLNSFRSQVKGKHSIDRIPEPSCARKEIVSLMPLDIVILCIELSCQFSALYFHLQFLTNLCTCLKERSMCFLPWDNINNTSQYLTFINMWQC